MSLLYAIVCTEFKSENEICTLVLNISRAESETLIFCNLYSLFLGGSEQGSGFSTVVSASGGPALSAPNQSSASSDKYAALAELDSVFSSTATSSNAYTSTSNVSRYFLLDVVVTLFIDLNNMRKSSSKLFLKLVFNFIKNGGNIRCV